MEKTNAIIIYENISFLCKQKGVKIATMCRETGVNQNIISALKKNKDKKGISAVTANKIAKYFNVSVAYILGEEQKEMPVIVDEQIETPSLEGLDDVIIQIVEKLNVMSAVERSRALGYVDSLIASRETVDVPHK